MNPLVILNPIFLLIIAIMLMVAWMPVRQSVRRIVAVLAGCVAGYGAGASVNALFTNITSWLVSAHVLSSTPEAPVILSTGDIMTGLMIAGSGLGLLAAMFIRDPARHPEEEASPEAVERAAAGDSR